MQITKFNKIGGILLGVISLVMLVIFFLIKDLGGDIGDVPWRFMLLKLHLSNDFAMPYFTPARCGGFHLAADSHDPLFTIYMMISFFIPNILWAIKFGNLFLSLILAAGIFYWLEHLGVKDKLIRFFIGLLSVFSGYWLINVTTGGHIWAHGYAYTPWVMLLIEILLKKKPSWNRGYMIPVWGLVLFFCLLINSGYYWLQVAVPMIVFRFIAEVLMTKGQQREDQIKRIGIIAVIGLAAILLSWPRLGGIYEFQIKKFPRFKGNGIDSWPLINNTWDLAQHYWLSFFNPDTIRGAIKNYHLNVYWDYCNYMGMLSLIPLGLGLLKIKEFIKSRAIMGIAMACIFQFGLIRTMYVSDMQRFFFPLYNQLTWNWRGSGIQVFFLLLLIACGYEIILKRKGRIFSYLALGLMILTLSDLTLINLTQTDFSVQPKFREILESSPKPLSRPLEVNNIKCNVGNLFGYHKAYPKNISIFGASVHGSSPVYLPERFSLASQFYNMHDVRRLAGPEANNSYYMKHPWPLWPKEDSEQFEKFINYKQVIPLPPYLKILNRISFVAWLFYLILGVRLFIFKKRFAPFIQRKEVPMKSLNKEEGLVAVKKKLKIFSIACSTMIVGFVVLIIFIAHINITSMNDLADILYGKRNSSIPNFIEILKADGQTAMNIVRMNSYLAIGILIAGLIIVGLWGCMLRRNFQLINRLTDS